MRWLTNGASSCAHLMLCLRRVRAYSSIASKPALLLSKLEQSLQLTNPVDANEYLIPTPDPQDEIVIAMSLGVDSSVAAALYKQKYKNVRGIYMANWSQTAKCTEADWNDVKRVCDQLDMPCSRVNFEREYWEDVFTPMIDMYRRGLTPNPDTGCNRFIKFGVMLEYLTKLLGDLKWWLVTGHYARIMRHNPTGEVHLLRGFSQQKDQLYYLSSVAPQLLLRVLMPIGHYVKPAVRQLAQDFDLHVQSKPDSQGLCFVSQDQSLFRDFLNEYIPPNPGNIITEDGKVWGQHQGLWHATIGQKLAILMPQGDPNYKGVWFVSEKRYDTNELVIVRGRDNPKLFADKVKANEWRWLVDPKTVPSEGLTMQYRSLQTPVKIESWVVKDSTIELQLCDAQRAMAPGQNLVLYNGNQVLGSGVIC